MADLSEAVTARPWRIVTATGPADQLHIESAAAVGGATPASRVVRILEATATAVVLGSTQAEADFDAGALAASGMVLARRRSGGGAVVVGPGELTWIDFVVPAGDPLWQPDVGRAAWWVGDLWAQALAAAGFGAPVEVWRGPLQRAADGRRVCFAGLGSGEVTSCGRKVVGVSQRRTRSATLFQTAALWRWDAARITGVLAQTPPRRLGAAAMGVGEGIGRRLSSTVCGLLMP